MSNVVLDHRPRPADPLLDPAVRILYGAIETLDERGWCQGSLHDPVGRACVYGAVISSATSVGILVALDALRETVGVTRAEELWDWNDAYGRTVDEVRAALVETIERLVAPEAGLPGKGKRVRVVRDPAPEPTPLPVPEPVKEPAKVGA